MAKNKTCASCDHFIPFDDPSKGGCSLLSTVESNENVPAGAEGEFWCSADWGCASHSANEPVAMPEDPGEMQVQTDSAEPTQRNRRASEYL